MFILKETIDSILVCFKCKKYFSQQVSTMYDTSKYVTVTLFILNKKKGAMQQRVKPVINKKDLSLGKLGVKYFQYNVDQLQNLQDIGCYQCSSTLLTCGCTTFSSYSF